MTRNVDANWMWLAAVGAPVRTTADPDRQLVERIVSLLPNDKRPTVPIRIVNPKAMQKTSDPGAFTLDREPTIYLSNQTVAFERAPQRDLYAEAVIASCIWHEEQHVRGFGEAQAYEAQIELVMQFVHMRLMEGTRSATLLRTLRGLREAARHSTR